MIQSTALIVFAYLRSFVSPRFFLPYPNSHFSSTFLWSAGICILCEYIRQPGIKFEVVREPKYIGATHELAKADRYQFHMPNSQSHQKVKGLHQKNIAFDSLKIDGYIPWRGRINSTIVVF